MANSANMYKMSCNCREKSMQTGICIFHLISVKVRTAISRFCVLGCETSTGLYFQTRDYKTFLHYM